MASTQGPRLLNTPGRIVAWTVAWFIAALVVLGIGRDRTGLEFFGLAALVAACFAVGAWRAVRRLREQTGQ